jgi:hypothetical protein
MDTKEKDFILIPMCNILSLPLHIPFSLYVKKMNISPSYLICSRKRGPNGDFITPNVSPNADYECNNVDGWKFYDGPL